MTVSVGRWNKLTLLKQLDFGWYLDGGTFGEILLPRRYVPEGVEVGQELDVFIYYDSEDRPIATTETPKVEVGKCAVLRVVSKASFGVFMDWGLAKDVVCPFREQQTPMEVGKSYGVILFVDDSGRISASSKLHQFLHEEVEEGEFHIGQEVDVLPYAISPLGVKAVVGEKHLGLIHKTDVTPALSFGRWQKGYIKLVREDGRLDLSIAPTGKKARDDLQEKILIHLHRNGGEMNVTDKASPDVIEKTFGVSKAAYKKALGTLFKQRKIQLTDAKVKLL